MTKIKAGVILPDDVISDYKNGLDRLLVTNAFNQGNKRVVFYQYGFRVLTYPIDYIVVLHNSR